MKLLEKTQWSQPIDSWLCDISTKHQIRHCLHSASASLKRRQRRRATLRHGVVKLNLLLNYSLYKLNKNLTSLLPSFHRLFTQNWKQSSVTNPILIPPLPPSPILTTVHLSRPAVCLLWPWSGASLRLSILTKRLDPRLRIAGRCGKSRDHDCDYHNAVWLICETVTM